MKKKTKIIIATIITILSCYTIKVKAETYNQISNGVKYYTWDNGEYIYNGQSDEIHYLNNISAYYRFIQTTELKDNSQVLFPGQYLIEFYVYSTYGTMSNITCYDLKSDFQNVNMTTGNWVSNEIKSQCVDLYKTTYNGWNAYRILYKFTYNGSNTGADGITELRYSINSSPKDFFYNMTEGADIGMSSSAIYDYDSSLISQFNDYKQNQTIISQNGQIISGLDTLNTTQNNNTNTIINNNNQNTQEIIDNQNSNTDKQIESQIACTEKIINKNNIIIPDKYLSTNGELLDSSNFGITDYYEIKDNTTIQLLERDNGGGKRICFYNSNKTLLNCEQANRYTINNNIQIPQNTKYVRFTIEVNTNLPIWKIYNCQNGNQAMNDSINDLKDADYTGETEQPNKTEYDNYQNNENELLENMEEMDLSKVNIAIDNNSSNFVWDTMTRIIQSNGIIFSMIISILSVGIIKLMLSR